MNVIPPLPIVGTGAITRASTGTYFDKAGVLQTAANDVLRLSYNPANPSAAPVALIEAAATNLLFYSSDLGNATWFKSAATVSVNTVTAPDGTLTADAITFSGSGWVGQDFGTPVGTYTYSLFAKTASRVLLIGGGGAVSEISFSTQDAGGGWYRQAVTFTITSGALQPLNVPPAGASFPYVLSAFGAQLETGLVATSPIATVGASATRAADIVTGSGLIYSSAIEAAPALYVGGTTYGAGATVSVAGTLNSYDCYTSLQAGNIGHTPATSPTWWAFAGTTYGAYGAGTFALGDRVINTTTHNVYESLIASNTGNALTDETKWFLVGKTIKWAQFDVLRNTATVGASPLVTILAPGVRIDAIALLGLVATSVNITMVLNGVTVYSYTQNLNQREVLNGYDYCFKPFGTQKALALFNLPPYSTAVTTITLVNAGGLVECGGCFIGSAVYIGDIQYEAESDALNFSSVTRDAQGNATLTPERNVPKVIGQIFLPKSLVNTAYELRDKLNGTTAVWASINDGTDGYFNSLLIQGFYRRFTINVKYPQHAIISVELEEV
ncbi:MAG: hypothetical protein JWQ01_4893 [Massilia sp.]|nr:hypothetical protein [Massilia sp.]